MSVLSQIKAVLFLVLLLVTSILGSLCVNGALLPILLVRPQLYRWLFDFGNGLWQWQVAFLLEKFIGLDVEISGDEIQSDEQSVVIMNHRTCFDWMYFWNLMIRQCGVCRLKIIVKSALRNVPGGGWGMQGAGYLFLNRKWDEDQNYLQTMIDYFAAVNYKTHILIFPEGTDFNAASKQRSDLFAAKNNMSKFSYVLHPRTTGLTFLTTQLKQLWNKVTIYDVTIAYSSTFPQNERELVSGHLPGKVHFHVRRYPPSEYPSTPEGLASWCHDRWVAKEKLLEYFYANGRFGNDSGELIEQPEVSRTWLQKMWLEICLYTVTIVWLSGSAFAVIAFMWWPFVRFVFISQTLMFAYLWYRGSGFEIVQTSYFNRFFKQTPKKD